MLIRNSIEVRNVIDDYLLAEEDGGMLNDDLEDET